MIPAHDSPLAALAFDASGTKLATASEKVRLSGPGETSPATQPVATRASGSAALRGAPDTRLRAPARSWALWGQGTEVPCTARTHHCALVTPTGCGTEDGGRVKGETV